VLPMMPKSAALVLSAWSWTSKRKARFASLVLYVRRSCETKRQGRFDASIAPAHRIQHVAKTHAVRLTTVLNSGSTVFSAVSVVPTASSSERSGRVLHRRSSFRAAVPRAPWARNFRPPLNFPTVDSAESRSLTTGGRTLLHGAPLRVVLVRWRSAYNSRVKEHYVHKGARG